MRVSPIVYLALALILRVYGRTYDALMKNIREIVKEVHVPDQCAHCRTACNASEILGMRIEFSKIYVPRERTPLAGVSTYRW